MALLAFFFSGPFSVLATAAGVVSVPIIIHLLNRKRFRVVGWAAMRFLLAAQKKNSRRLRLEQLLLLLVRAFLVLLLILAMASVTPWAEEFWAAHLPEGGLLSTPGGRRTHRILVLDGSFSMGLKVGDTTCFEKARAIAERLVQESKDNGRGDGFSVVLMAAPPRTIVGGDTGPAEKLESVLDEIQKLRLPHGNSDLARTLDRVASLLKSSPGKFVEKEVYFLTDLQKTTWVLPQPAQVASFLPPLNKARTILVDVGSEEPPRNLAITRLALDLKYPAVPVQVKVPFTAKVHNYGQETELPIRVTLYVGRLHATANDPPYELREAPGAATERMMHGENTVSFEYQFDAPGDYIVQARLEGDALALDDVRSIVVRVRDKVPVLLVNGKPAADLYDQATEYLFDALNPYQDGAGVPAQGGRAASPIRVRKIPAAEFSDAGLADLTTQDCVFLCDVPRISPPEAQRLEAHVQRGGGLVICLGPNAAKNLDSYNEVLYRNGRGLLPARLIGKQQAPKGYYFHFAADDPQAFKLPPLAAFELERDRARLLKAPFQEFVRAELPSSATALVTPRKVLSFVAQEEKSDQPKAADTAAYPSGPAVIEWQPPLPNQKEGRTSASRTPVPSNRGRVVLITSTVNTDWTDWPRQGNFVWFMQEVLAHAAAGRLREQSTTVGDTLEAYVAGQRGVQEQEGKEVTLHTPDGREEKTQTIAREESVLWRWSNTDQSGVYRAVIGSSPEERGFAVNVPSAGLDQYGSESDLTRADAEKLAQLYLDEKGKSWEFQVVRDLSQVKRDSKIDPGTATMQRQELGTGIARGLLLVVLGLMALEVVLAWYCGHYSAVHERDRAPQGWSRGKYAVHLQIGVNVTMVFLMLFSLATAFTLVHAVWTGDFLGFLPSSFRAWIEEGLNIPPPAPGEARRWHLEFRPYLWDAAADLWLAPLLGAGLAALAFFVYSKESRVISQRPGTSGRWPAVQMAVLRVGLFSLMLTVFLTQLRSWFERESWPDVVILIDDSGSMSVADKYLDGRVKVTADSLRDLAKELLLEKVRQRSQELVNTAAQEGENSVGTAAERMQQAAQKNDWDTMREAIGSLVEATRRTRNDAVKAEAERLIETARREPNERLPLAQALTTGGDPNLVTRLLHDRQVKIHVYRCSERAARVASASKDEEAEDAVEGIRSLDAWKSNDSSQLGAAVRQVLNDFRGTSLAAVVMFTDGATTEGEDLRQVSKYAEQLKVPLFFVGLGDAQEPRDLEISELEVADSVFVNDTLVFRFNLNVRGYGERPGPVKVVLHEKGSKEPLASKTITVDAAGKPKAERLDYKPTTPGVRTYVIETPVREDETDKTNNSQQKEVMVTEAKMIRILYVEGYGRWEFRYLKTLLERESDRVKDNKTMDLKVYLVEPGEKGFAAQDRSALDDLPGKAELNSYDVILLGDVDPSPRDNGGMIRFLNNVASAVRDGGRGLLMIAGERYAPHAYKDSPLRDVLPIDITSDRPPDEPEGGRTKSYRAELTQHGRMHPIFSFNEKDNEPIWKGLQKMYWYAEGYQPKPAAEVLAVHPEVKTAGGSKESLLPLVVHHFVGAGRAIFLGFHETWRWRWREDEKHFNEFWIQTVRYLARSKLGRVELRLNKDKPYLRGEHITVSVRYPGDAPAPAEDSDVRVAVLNKDTRERTTLKLAHVKGSRAHFEGVLTRTPVGHYEFLLEKPMVAGGSQPRAEGLVIAPPGELQRTRMNQGEMEEAARETHGRFYTLAEAEQLLDDLPNGTRTTLNAPGPPALIWNHAILLVVALLFLSAEWILRKRYHLL
jgi:hypothetical protein